MPADYRDSTSAGGDVTSFNCAKPSGVIAGDVLVAFHVSVGTAVGMGTPTGGTTWLQLGSITDSFLIIKVWHKIAGGSEPANYGFTQNDEGVAIIVAVMDADTTATPIIATSTAGSGSAVTTPSITPATGADFEIRFAAAARFAGSDTFTPPATYTEREDLDGDGFTYATVATKQLVSASASGAQNFTADFTTPDDRAGVTVAVASVVDPGSPQPLISRGASHRAASW